MLDTRPFFNFDENLTIEFSCAQKAMVTTVDPYGKRFRRYSLGPFEKVIMDEDLFLKVCSS